MAPKTKRRVRVALFLDPTQHEKLRTLSQMTRVPWAAYVREGVDIVLKKYSRKRK